MNEALGSRNGHEERLKKGMKRKLRRLALQTRPLNILASRLEETKPPGPTVIGKQRTHNSECANPRHNCMWDTKEPRTVSVNTHDQPVSRVKDQVFARDKHLRSENVLGGDKHPEKKIGWIK